MKDTHPAAHSIHPRKRQATGPLRQTVWDVLGIIGGTAGAFFGYLVLSFPNGPSVEAQLILMVLGIVLAGTVLIKRA